MKILRFLMVITFSVLVLCQPSYGEKLLSENFDAKVVINGLSRQYSEKPHINEGRLMLPLRAILNDIGVTDDRIKFDATDRSVTIEAENKKIMLKTNSSKAYVNGGAVEIGIGPQIVSNRMFVPVRFVSESLGKIVEWDKNTRTVFIADYDRFNRNKKFLNEVENSMNLLGSYLRNDVVKISAALKNGEELASSEFSIKSNNNYMDERVQKNIKFKNSFNSDQKEVDMFLSENELLVKREEKQSRVYLSQEEKRDVYNLKINDELSAAGIRTEEQDGELVVLVQSVLPEYFNLILGINDIDGLQFENMSSRIHLDKKSNMINSIYISGNTNCTYLGKAISVNVEVISTFSDHVTSERKVMALTDAVKDSKYRMYLNLLIPGINKLLEYKLSNEKIGFDIFYERGLEKKIKEQVESEKEGIQKILVENSVDLESIKGHVNRLLAEINMENNIDSIVDIDNQGSTNPYKEINLKWLNLSVNEQNDIFENSIKILNKNLPVDLGKYKDYLKDRIINQYLKLEKEHWDKSRINCYNHVVHLIPDIRNISNEYIIEIQYGNILDNYTNVLKLFNSSSDESSVKKLELSLNEIIKDGINENLNSILEDMVIKELGEKVLGNYSAILDDIKRNTLSFETSSIKLRISESIPPHLQGNPEINKAVEEIINRFGNEVIEEVEKDLSPMVDAYNNKINRQIIDIYKKQPKIYINNKGMKSEVLPQIQEGRTLIPIRSASELLGADVKWDGITRKATITKNGKQIILGIGDNKALVDGIDVFLDAPPRIIDSRTFVPLRFVSETFGLKVNWVGDISSAFLE